MSDILENPIPTVDEPSEELSILKVLMGEECEDIPDSVLLVYLRIAKDKVLGALYPYDTTKTEVPERYLITQCKIAQYFLNKRGAEGQISHSENGISRTYEVADVPKSLLAEITPYVGAINLTKPPVEVSDENTDAE